ncbi:MAG: SUMF1/EgtB/PvdO family nonheme iron enzyme [Planctomycetes bacterium]|nr:SUMF1/EgtB/PvdO family nonheme iron enzyme [Planctomycetota bacterium]
MRRVLYLNLTAAVLAAIVLGAALALFSGEAVEEDSAPPAPGAHATEPPDRSPPAGSPRPVRRLSLVTNPPGVEVVAQALDPETRSPAGSRVRLGLTPLAGVEIVSSGNVFLLSIAAAHGTVSFAVDFAGSELALDIDLDRLANGFAYVPPVGDAGAFYVSRRRVTGGEYARFLDALSDPRLSARHRPRLSFWTGSSCPDGWEDRPVVGVDYDDALAYSLWAGARLPTSGEWDRFASGSTDGIFEWVEAPADSARELELGILEGEGAPVEAPLHEASFRVVLDAGPEKPRSFLSSLIAEARNLDGAERLVTRCLEAPPGERFSYLFALLERPAGLDLARPEGVGRLLDQIPNLPPPEGIRFARRIAEILLPEGRGKIADLLGSLGPERGATVAARLQAASAAWSELAAAHVETWAPQQSERVLEAAVELDPTNAEALFLRGFVYLGMGRYEESVADNTRALEVEPRLVTAMNNRAAAHFWWGRYDRVAEDAGRVIEAEPGMPNPHFFRGAAAYFLGRLDDFLADFEEGAKKNPDYMLSRSQQLVAARNETTDALLVLATALWACGRSEELQTLLDRLAGEAGGSELHARLRELARPGKRR